MYVHSTTTASDRVLCEDFTELHVDGWKAYGKSMSNAPPFMLLGLATDHNNFFHWICNDLLALA